MSPPPPLSGPEAAVRVEIDAALEAASWVVQNREEMNVSVAQGVAVREFKLKQGHGYADYLLFVDGKAIGVLEAKAPGHTLIGVEPQSTKYANGLPDGLNPPITPLPFLYVSTGAVTKFTNLLDPEPRSRFVFHVHRPETLAEWLSAPTLDAWVRDNGAYTAADDTKPSSLRARLRAMPELDPGGLYPNQIQAIANLEASMRQDKPRALLQMATGSGKTLTSVAEIYRLIKFGGARRVLFLVDRSNLGEQAEKEFQNFETPDDHRKFTELYNVQRLTSNTIDAASRVVITTIQRLFSMLKGDETFEEPEGDEAQLDAPDSLTKEPIPVAFNATIPPEHFDIIFIDECHRSIYSLWRQVLEYFDAFLIGLTATPAKHTFGFFNKNLVMEYGHEQAVVDGVNVDFEIYKVRTKITEGGSTIEAEDGTMIGLRDRRTRKVRWETPDDAVSYASGDLDRNVVAKDQLRLIVRTFRDKVLKETFRDRKEVPKTLIFAKDDSHAEDIVEIVREEFGRGNDFCTKITYKTSGKRPKELIQDFRTGYNPRIVVTVDLIATGTDIRPVEIVMFLRSVKSRVLFEQMKGRGVRIIDPNELKAVTPDAQAKTHFVIVDCVGVTETELSETQPLERQKHVPMRDILEHVAAGGTNRDALSSLASRLSRLDKQCGPDDIERVVTTGGTTLKAISHAIVDALDPDRQISAARNAFQIPTGHEPTDSQVKRAAETLIKAAVASLATQPALRQLVQDLKRQFDQIIDEVSQDELLADKTGLSAEARDKARTLVISFETFLEEHKDEITALQFFYSVPHRDRLHYGDKDQPIPKGCRWSDVANPQMEGDRLESHYRKTLETLGKQGGMLGLIFRKSQNKIQDPAKLRRLIVDLIGNEDWLVMSADVKGEAYEGLLERNAQDVKGGAGQYFTPRSVIGAMVDCLQPKPGEVIYGPACGTGGFLLAAHDYIAGQGKLDRDQKNHLRYKALRGVELVDGVSRLCAMNLFLHGVGPDDNEREPPIKTEDALRNEPSDHADVVLTNPPFGKKSSVTVVNEEGDTDREALVYNRPDFWVTTSNKQLNFVQHVKSLLKVHGRAGVVLPDNVLFEGGAGETVRRKLLHECDLHTILRLPTGIFYAQGVKANVLFFDRKPGSDKPWTKKVWVYDHRTNCHYTLKTKQMMRANLDDFVACYRPGDIHNRKQTWSEKKNPEGRWRSFTFEEIAARDKCSLDLFWLRDESLEDSASLPDPHILAQEIADDLRSALGQIDDILGDLEARAAKGPRQSAP